MHMLRLQHPFNFIVSLISILEIWESWNQCARFMNGKNKRTKRTIQSKELTIEIVLRACKKARIH